MEIMKALIPAAGLGTRFLPFTKTMPKEMLPLLNKPALQLVLEECKQAALRDVILVTGRGKSVIADYFDHDPHLQNLLHERSATQHFQDLESLINQISLITIRQSQPLGWGHAVWLARHLIGKEYFAICLPDDLIVHDVPGIAQLMRIAKQEKASVIAVQEVPHESIGSYGVIGIKKQITPSLFQVSHIVEKPQPKDAPSNLAVVGRYVISHKIFQALEEVSVYAQKELHLSDALSQMIHNNERVFAYKIQGTRYDIGTPLGWLKAVVGNAWNDKQLGPELRAYIQELSSSGSLLNSRFMNERLK